MLDLVSYRVTGQQRAVALGAASILLVITAASFPFARASGPVVLPLQAILSAVVIGANLVTAFLLFSQFYTSRTPSLAILAGTFLYSSLVNVPYLLSFPGVFSEFGLLGGSPQTAQWYSISWHAVFPLLAIAYVASERRLGMRRINRRSANRAIAVTVAGVFILLAGTMAGIAFAAGHAPALMEGSAYSPFHRFVLWPAIGALQILALIFTAYGSKMRTSIHLWLAVAIFAALLEESINFIGGNHYSLGWYVSRLDTFVSANAVLFAIIAEIHALYSRLAHSVEALEQLAAIDGLTGIANRRSLDARIETELALVSERQEPLSLIMADIDEFKRFNDHYGHLAGDDCLKRVAAALRDAARRPTDFVARYGGEEFALLLPDTDEDGARVVAERARRYVESLAITHEGCPRSASLSISLGTATVRDRDMPTFERLISRADRALYAAKAAGRNRVGSSTVDVVPHPVVGLQEL